MRLPPINIEVKRVVLRLSKVVVTFLALCWLAFGPPDAVSSGESVAVPILLYHRFGPVVADGMTVTTSVFASQLTLLKDRGYTVIPLRQLIAYLQGEGLPPPPRSVVITADDGHKSVFTDMFPLVKQYRIPVTLFIYPSAISNASYALTWDQLRTLQASGLFEVQSHTYWHPNFKTEKKRLAAGEYIRFVDWQLKESKQKLEAKLSIRADMLAWPFGIYDDELIKQASKAGYVAGFTLERRPAGIGDNLLALPRYLVTNGDTGTRFERLLSGRSVTPADLAQRAVERNEQGTQGNAKR